eukprot:1159347-Pelagomonas_calceolata.AAC.7
MACMFVQVCSLAWQRDYCYYHQVQMPGRPPPPDGYQCDVLHCQGLRAHQAEYPLPPGPAALPEAEGNHCHLVQMPASSSLQGCGPHTQATHSAALKPSAHCRA